jgi:chloramphenicol 3-O-phosphotransferase
MPSILEEPMTPVAQHVVQPMAVEVTMHVGTESYMYVTPDAKPEVVQFYNQDGALAADPLIWFRIPADCVAWKHTDSIPEDIVIPADYDYGC